MGDKLIMSALERISPKPSVIAKRLARFTMP